jgi:hypothetical protein
VSRGLYVSGGALLISAVVHIIFHSQIAKTALCIVVGYGAGFLAKKSFTHYSFIELLERALLKIEAHIPFVRPIVLVIALVASCIFPSLFQILAGCIGFLSGVLHKTQVESPSLLGDGCGK